MAKSYLQEIILIFKTEKEIAKADDDNSPEVISLRKKSKSHESKARKCLRAYNDQVADLSKILGPKKKDVECFAHPQICPGLVVILNLRNKTSFE